ncbi:MAG: ThiF family adenylyltransferase [Firmicutes bacterium]|nr:ThiF family adenylyltransferase [Bacillota bacterium]
MKLLKIKPDLPDYGELFMRNIGIVSKNEQEILKNATVVIAGVGGDGGLIAETLARAGIGHIKVADPGEFEACNINRQNGCYIDTLGANKAQEIGDIVKRINPFCKVDVYETGIHEKNICDFIEGASIVIDESEFTMHEIAVMLAREARKRHLPLITGLNIGFGAIVMAFMPDSLSFESYLGFSESQPIEEILSSDVPIHKWCPWLPSYIDIQVLRDVVDGKISVPGISPSVSLVSAAVSTEVLMYLLKRKPLITAPRYIWIDLYKRKMKIRKARKVAFYASLALMGLNSRKNKSSSM